jgi:D-alanyl-D-alanine carboxypeptidase/D-alanyl-D-alanine-endopeptidase (penicillin-binding protein 4)
MLRNGPSGPSFAAARPTLAALAAVAVLVVAPPAAVAAEAPLSKRLASALAVPHVNHALESALAVDLRTGTVVFVRRPAASLAPASNEKLFLAYALLVRLGPTYRIPTLVLGDGAQDGNTWRGDLVLTGYGDPTLRTPGLRRLARQIRAKGITQVSGAVGGDESYFDTRRTGPGWKPEFYIEESPPLSALVVDRAEYRGRTNRNPALAAASRFRAVLAEEGVRVRRKSTVRPAGGDAAQLASIASPPMLKLLRLVNSDSDNLTAELLLKHLGAAAGDAGTTAAGAAVVRRILADAGVPLAGVRFVDGSGLSLLDRLTAQSLVAVLAAAWEDPLLRGSFLASLAVSGLRGTLEDRMRKGPATGRVFAKTGTTALASTLAGYADGRYAFAILHNGPPLSSWWCRVAQDRFATALVRAP